jgi:hypothetical protein
MDEPTPEDPVTKFSQKTIILRSCTPIKPSTCPTRALYQPDGDSDMWDNVDEERRKMYVYAAYTAFDCNTIR